MISVKIRITAPGEDRTGIVDLVNAALLPLAAAHGFQMSIAARSELATLSPNRRLILETLLSLDPNREGISAAQIRDAVDGKWRMRAASVGVPVSLDVVNGTLGMLLRAGSIERPPHGYTDGEHGRAVRTYRISRAGLQRIRPPVNRPL